MFYVYCLLDWCAPRISGVAFKQLEDGRFRSVEPIPAGELADRFARIPGYRVEEVNASGSEAGAKSPDPAPAEAPPESAKAPAKCKK